MRWRAEPQQTADLPQAHRSLKIRGSGSGGPRRARPGRGRTVGPMDDRALTDRSRPLSVQLEVNLDRQPISGCLRPKRGAEEQFVGWLGFVDALKRLNEQEEHQ